ncbi:atypical/RIO/RIO1 protein kinase [Dipodascopsis uninucleata]
MATLDLEDDFRIGPDSSEDEDDFSDMEELRNSSSNDTVNAKGNKILHDPNAILAKYASRIKVDELVPGIKNKLTDKSDRATIEQVLDPRTCKILAKFINRGDLYEINGCISTGKEANVYHALTESGEHRAVKIYKTSILVFKDRDRYVTGEYRFRHGYSKHNPRKMVRLWAEKEMRNLSRIYAAGIPSPKALALKMHVLVMDFIGNSEGWASPRLHDAHLQSEQYVDMYHQLVAYMIIMYQKCRLVHADLSEYNLLYHEGKLYIIDVSQSVEHDHPHSLEFLRMDIKNVTSYFSKNGVACFSERQLFELITNEREDLSIDDLVQTLAGIDPYTEDTEVDEAVFREMYIPQTLEQVYDIERDTDKISSGQGSELIYKDLVNLRIEKRDIENEEKDREDEDSEDDASSDSDETEAGNDYEERKQLKGKKYENKEDKKERKKLVKEQKKEKRTKKIPKHIKKKLVNNSKRH